MDIFFNYQMIKFINKFLWNIFCIAFGHFIISCVMKISSHNGLLHNIRIDDLTVTNFYHIRCTMSSFLALSWANEGEQWRAPSIIIKLSICSYNLRLLAYAFHYY